MLVARRLYCRLQCRVSERLRSHQKWDQALAANNIYTIIAVLVVYWGATFVTLRGLKASSTISKWGGMIGTIIPAAVLILVGILYLF